MLVDEAFASGWDVLECFVSADSDFEIDVPTFELDDRTFASVSDVKTPQGVIAIVSMEAPFRTKQTAREWCLVADGIADPGNLGTIMRSAEAAGAHEVFLLNNSVDPFSPKVVRASAGALFHIPTRIATYEEVAHAGYRTLGLTSHETVSGRTVRSIYEVTVTGEIAVVVGSEAHGIAPDAPIDEWVTIPHRGRAESLNAAMAATVMCMHVAHVRAESVPPSANSLH